jgi:hypothetical protein
MGLTSTFIQFPSQKITFFEASPNSTWTENQGVPVHGGSELSIGAALACVQPPAPNRGGEELLGAEGEELPAREKLPPWTARCFHLLAPRTLQYFLSNDHISECEILNDDFLKNENILDLTP